MLFNVVLFIHYLSILCSQLISIPEYSIYDGVGLYFNYNKKRELFVFISETTALFVVFNSFIYIYTRFNTFAITYINTRVNLLIRSKRSQKYFIILLIFLPILVLFIGSQNSMSSFLARLLIETQLMVILIALPFCIKIASKVNSLSFVIYKQKILNTFVSIFCSRNIYLLLILIGFGQLIYLLFDPIINKIKIVNEYYSIPEKSIINNKYYDNSVFFNKDIGSPVTYKYDVLNGDYQSNGRLSLPSKSKGIDDSAKKNYSDEVIAFLKNNKYEIHSQILSRFMIHHNNFILSPVNEICLNRDYKEINAQYGLGSAIIISKILLYFGGLSLHGWLKLSYIFYLLYFMLFVLVVYVITKNIKLTAIIFILSLAVINYRGYDILLMPPGESPWRHFFDMIVLFFIYKYKSTDKIYYYILSLFVSVLSVFINPQIGLMILLAAVATGFFYAYYENRRKAITTIYSALSLLIGVIVYNRTTLATDFAKYYIDGLVGIEIPLLSILFIVSLFALGYFALFEQINKNNKRDYLSLIFLFFYSQALLFYVAWHFDKNGITARYFIYIFTVLLFMYNMEFHKLLNKTISSFIKVLIPLFVIIYYSNSVISVIRQKNEYDNIFITHKVYEWKIDKASIISTMNPLYFEQSINLIQKYTPYSKGVYMISKFDNILPFLSSRYSRMPFFDLSWYLITEKEVKNAINTIKNNNPQYIFVDSDIYRNFKNDIIDSEIPEIGYLSQESIWRVQRLELLDRVFNNISSDYKIVEKGILISVYKRK